MKLLCNIYRCAAKEGMYLYTRKDTRDNNDFATLPDALKQRIGQTTLAMTILLTPDKKLAAADAKKVIESIEQQGFYLQMPSSPDPAMQAINKHNNYL